MGSPIAEMIYENTGIDLIYIIGAVVILLLIVLILNIVTLCKLKKLARKYDRFTRGQDAESLEDTILKYLNKVDGVEKLLGMTREEIINLRRNQRLAFQKMGLVKYDAFFDLSGQLSYALVLLDQKDNGFILNSVYSRDGSYSYIKEIKDGSCETPLSKEEQKALEQAKNKA